MAAMTTGPAGIFMPLGPNAVMTHTEYAALWVLSLFTALAIVVAKLGHTLFGIALEPPEDPKAAAHWHRRRRWLLVSELSALPAFATIAVAVTVYFKLPPVTSCLLSMGMGGLGFGLLLSGFQYLARLWFEKRTKELV